METGNQMSNHAMPWVERYRPTKLDDVLGNTDAILSLKRIRDTLNVPNMMLCGPPGIGKTTAVQCLARELLGEHYAEAVLELNASDERGIDVVRSTIKAFCEKKVTLPPHIPKIVILDEADSMTASAFQALRRTMELHARSTRFVLACNTPEKVIEPIQSRCVKLIFRPLSDAEVHHRLTSLCSLEGVLADDDALHAIEIISEGDLRKAINALQTCAVGGARITADDVYQRNDTPSASVIDAALQATVRGDYDVALREAQKLREQGFSATDIVAMVLRVAQRTAAPEEWRICAVETISDLLLVPVDSWLQVCGMLARICLFA